MILGVLMELTPEQTDDVRPLISNRPAETKAVSLQSTWLWQPNLIVFISSGCIMILELVAGRMIAPYVGVSLYTWTSIIGIVLAGISLGNYLSRRHFFAGRAVIIWHLDR
jgi:predicted membrane-bound spermidine synthase